MKNFTIHLLLLNLLISCTDHDSRKMETKGTLKIQLMEVDKAFAAMSKGKGMKKAFMDFIDSNGVLLRSDHLPVVGAKAIDYLLQQNDSEYILTWQPGYADVSASGDLGYTYGVYQLHLKERDTSLYGSYVSIWKKQQDGKWKFVLDCANEGIGNE